MKFLLLAFFIPTLTYAISFSRDGDRLLMSGPRCSLLNEEVRALSEWSGTLESAPTCLCENKQCSVEISAVSPPVVTKVLLRTTAFNGPNCWNAALVGAGILSDLRYTSPQEMKFWLKTCQEKNSPDTGDIVSYKNGKGEEIHSYVYVSPNLGFSKNGNQWYAPYLLQPHKEIRDLYKKSEDVSVTFYACSPQIYNGPLVEMEKRISELAMVGRVESDVELKDLEKKLTEVFLNAETGSDDYFRANSLASQVSSLLFRFYTH